MAGWMFRMRFLYFWINSGLMILINPARQTRPFLGVTPFISRVAMIFWSYCQRVPTNPLLGIVSVLTPSFCAILRPSASGLFDITIVGLIGIFCLLTALRIASILLPLPDIRIPKFSKMLFLYS